MTVGIILHYIEPDQSVYVHVLLEMACEDNQLVILTGQVQHNGTAREHLRWLGEGRRSGTGVRAHTD